MTTNQRQKARPNKRMIRSRSIRSLRSSCRSSKKTPGIIHLPKLPWDREPSAPSSTLGALQKRGRYRFVVGRVESWFGRHREKRSPRQAEGTRQRGGVWKQDARTSLQGSRGPSERMGEPVAGQTRLRTSSISRTRMSVPRSGPQSHKGSDAGPAKVQSGSSPIARSMSFKISAAKVRLNFT